MSALFKSAPEVTVAAAGTAERLVDGDISGVLKIYVTAPSTNTGAIWVGDVDVDASGGVGIQVPKGTIFSIDGGGEMLDIHNIWVDADTSGDKASVSYVRKV